MMAYIHVCYLGKKEYLLIKFYIILLLAQGFIVSLTINETTILLQRSSSI